MYSIDKVTYNKLKNLIDLIDKEESKENYEDIDTDSVLEYYDEIINTIRSVVK